MKNIGITLDSNTSGEYSDFPWYALRENYATSLSSIGAAALPLPHDLACVDHYISLIDGLVVTGGDFDIDPSFYTDDAIHKTVTTKSTRTAFEFAMIKAALAKDMPILGICGGQQLMNVALGGTLIQHIPDEINNALPHSTGYKISHAVKIKKDTQFFDLIGQKNNIMVNSSHHQAIKDPAPGAIINAVAEDGVIEGIEAPAYKFCIGVQWHPEYFLTEEDKMLFQSFIAATEND